MGTSCVVCCHTRTEIKGSEPGRDAVARDQDLEKSQVRRGLCSSKEASHPGECSEPDSPARDLTASTEWKAKPPVNKKAALLEMEESRSVAGGTVAQDPCMKWEPLASPATSRHQANLPHATALVQEEVRRDKENELCLAGTFKGCTCHTDDGGEGPSDI